MSRDVQELKSIILNGVKQLTVTEAFSSWFSQANSTSGDGVIINNSFIYRKPLIKTSKNNQYLCLKVSNGSVDVRNVFVARPGELNSEFKLFKAQSANFPKLEPLDEALIRETERLGRLIFVLIGELRETSIETPVNHESVNKLIFNPASGSSAVTLESGKKVIVVNQLADRESAWNDIKSEFMIKTSGNLVGLETAFSDAFEKLQDKARLTLVLPGTTAGTGATSFISQLRHSVSEQRKLYKAALRRSRTGGTVKEQHLREVMRIGYNFAADAIKVLQLLVSVADLKAVVLWCTVKEHFDIAEAFHNLPWSRSHKKPSLERYKEIIGGARNRAFHNLLAFDRTIEADLEGVDVKARRLTLLPAHGQRNRTSAFDYEDRELVEILAGLTRAPEVAVPFEFWEKNLAIIESFERLLEKTEVALWALNRA